MASEPLTTLDLIAVGAVVIGLAGAVTALWFAFKSQVDDLKEQLQKGAAETEGLVSRIRSLETDRLTEVKDYAKRGEELNNRVLTVFSRVVTALQNLTETVSEWNTRPCVRDAVDHTGKKLDPTPLPQIETDTLLKNDDKSRRRRQEESAGP